MTLASYTDSNRWLDGNKVVFENEEDAGNEATEADRIIKAYLYGVFPDNINDWDISGTPEATPGIIVEIAGMLMASYRYAKLYSEEELGRSSYSAQLETRAMKLLAGVAEGTIDLSDKTYLSGAAWSADDFWPNDSDIDVDGNSNIKFTMGAEF